jgi:hypothetical protein
MYRQPLQGQSHRNWYGIYYQETVGCTERKLKTLLQNASVAMGGLILATCILWPVSIVAPRSCYRTVYRCCDFSSNGLGWHYIPAHCYRDHLVVATSHRGCHMSPLLLRATTTTTFRWYHPDPFATKRVTAVTSRLIPPRSHKVGLTHISTF